MKTKLKEKFWDYIIRNNPELMFTLQEGYSVKSYLEEKMSALRPQLELWKKQGVPDIMMEEKAMLALTKDLKPSKFHFIKNILEEDFKEAFTEFKETGTLTYEVVNLIEACKEAFEAIGFSEENRKSKRLSAAIKAIITQYLANHGRKR